MFHRQILVDLDATIRSLLTSYDHHKRAATRRCLTVGAGKPCRCQGDESFHADRAADLKARIDGMRRLLDIAVAENAAEERVAEETPDA